MKNEIKARDYELISAYLDNQLSDKDRALLETRLKSDHILQAELHEISKTRQLLKSLPKLRAPRNYFIQAESVQPRPSLRLAPIFGIVSAVASVVFALVLFGSSLFTISGPVAMAPAAQKMVETQVVQQESQRSEPALATPTQEAPMTMLGAPPETPSEAPTNAPEVEYKVLVPGVPTPTTIYLDALPPSSTPQGSPTSVEELNEISSFSCEQYYDSGNSTIYALPEECVSPTPTLTSTSIYSQTLQGMQPSPSAMATLTETPAETPTATPTPTPSATPTPTETPSPTATPSQTPIPTMMPPAVENNLPTVAAESSSELTAPNASAATGSGLAADQQQAASSQPTSNNSFLNYLFLSVEISLAFIAIVAGVVAIILRIKAGR